EVRTSRNDLEQGMLMAQQRVSSCPPLPAPLPCWLLMGEGMRWALGLSLAQNQQSGEANFLRAGRSVNHGGRPGVGGMYSADFSNTQHLKQELQQVQRIAAVREVELSAQIKRGATELEQTKASLATEAAATAVSESAEVTARIELKDAMAAIQQYQTQMAEQRMDLGKKVAASMQREGDLTRQVAELEHQLTVVQPSPMLFTYSVWGGLLQRSGAGGSGQARRKSWSWSYRRCSRQAAGGSGGGSRRSSGRDAGSSLQRLSSRSKAEAEAQVLQATNKGAQDAVEMSARLSEELEAAQSLVSSKQRELEAAEQATHGSSTAQAEMASELQRVEQERDVMIKKHTEAVLQLAEQDNANRLSLKPCNHPAAP
ncbi:hypothetical protein CYMTET_29663, partial [Cymbomonas tetramitiformis]